MIVVQRVRVRWSPAGRGAQQANARRGLDLPVALPEHLPSTTPVVVHDVLADEADGYVRRDEIHAGDAGPAHNWTLRLRHDGPSVVVERTPGGEVYPYTPRTTRLFTLAPGQVGRYRANFRLRGCVCDARWTYETWTVHVSNGPVAADRFSLGATDHDVDHRVHLYGGRRRASRS